MAALSITNATAFGRVRSRNRISRPRISCVTWDPEGILGPPQTGHIARREFQKKMETDSEAREAFQRQLIEEKERRRAARQARFVPDDPAGLTEYLLDTEAQELEFEIARLRPRLNQEFFSHLKFELGQLRFAVSRTKDMEDRLIELEAMQKVLVEGTEAYDKLQGDVITAKESLAKILRSKDVKATILEMVGRNELNRSLLTLLDENIANANMVDQKEAALYMERVRSAVVKYMTVST
ncbi:dimethylallyl, adenosine tRNA methylthiotransferase [Thalictrum thalictroides]|uniref:Dimethylallyl, adenosine tRNA methylthiotransferase n=1 Tax=Thalictrum thalictroides TaxID=46969 RepID=A0A7J6X2V4_THATH|nr:dimethylallyl, adenosine tRNA methylthiotransferase [Thalictrum thalictroides]